jgi:phage host-nuclease inhibitor protein Gam
MEAKESLQKFLDSETDQQGFTIDDDSKANWALRKIAQHKKKIEENNLLAEEEIYKIEAWNKQMNDEAQQSIDYFQSLLAEYAGEKRKSDPKFKTLKLPSGRIRFKKQQPQYVYDDDAVLESLKESGYTDFVKVKESVDKAGIKKQFKAVNGGLVDPDTGEFIDGVTVVDRDDKFEVVTE